MQFAQHNSPNTRGSGCLAAMVTLWKGFFSDLVLANDNMSTRKTHFALLSFSIAATEDWGSANKASFASPSRERTTRRSRDSGSRMSLYSFTLMRSKTGRRELHMSYQIELGMMLEKGSHEP